MLFSQTEIYSASLTQPPTIKACQEISDEENMILPRNNWILHQTECICRLVKCPDCKSEVQFHELLEHMVKEKCIASDDKYPNCIGKKATFGKKEKEYHFFSSTLLKPKRVDNFSVSKTSNLEFLMSMNNSLVKRLES